MNNKLVIVRGCPGTGKSTFVKEAFPNILHLENDMFHYHNGSYLFNQRKQNNAIEWCIDMTMLSLKRGMDVVVSNTFTKKSFVDSYKKIADLFGSKFEVYRMMGNFENIHDVPKMVLENMKNNFEDYPEEKFAFPNEFYDPSDELSMKYCVTEFKIGDHVKLDLNDKEAVVMDVRVATYGMIVLDYKDVDGNAGTVYSGDVEKV
jgi:hypothetical protein